MGWFHRASHEVGVLWAVHQVHHSSEEFNLTTAFRQPFFQGLFQLTHWFYLPAALAVPPSQFLVHSQFVFLFQFWIHSELIGDIGPLGLIFNTSTYHQVHHGSNRYCLDKNYGGFLSIWDRIFGTFQDLRPDEQTVYGLIDQPQFFNVVKHQLFYFPVLLGKVEGGPWWQKMTTTFALRSLREKNISQTSLCLLISILLCRWLLALFSTTTCLGFTQACPREAC